MAGSNAGRPTKLDQAGVNKLEEAFAFGASDLEACFYANISKQTLYNYQKKHPEFVDRKARLKERPILEARQSVIKHMRDDGHLAIKFLERKRKKEFGTRTDITSDGERLTNIIYLKPDLPDNYDGKSTELES